MKVEDETKIVAMAKVIKDEDDKVDDETPNDKSNEQLKI